MREYLLFTVLQRCIAVHIASSLPSLFLFWGVFSFLHFCDPFLLLCIHNLSSFSQTSFHLCSLSICPALSSFWPRRAPQSAVQLPCFILYFFTLPLPSSFWPVPFPFSFHPFSVSFLFSFCLDSHSDVLRIFSEVAWWKWYDKEEEGSRALHSGRGVEHFRN